jgi:NADPH2:quinone reductase
VRAVRLPEKTGPDAAVIADAPEPSAAHPWAGGERMLVEVRAAAVGFPDVLQSRGLYQHGTDAPYTAGGEYAGVVLEASGATGFRPGDRVAGLSVWGSMAERVMAIPHYAVKVPEQMSWTDAAATYVNYVTGLLTLSRAGFRDGEAVLVRGAAGGVGTAVLDLLRGRGAPLIAQVSTAAKESVARACGADDVVRTDGDWLGAVRSLTGGRGVDVVIDPVGEPIVDVLRSLDVGGRLMVVGFAGGSIPELPANRLLLRNLTVTGVAVDPWTRRFPAAVAALNRTLEGLMAEARVHPHVGIRLPFARADEALGYLERREATGKVVVEL